MTAGPGSASTSTLAISTSGITPLMAMAAVVAVAAACLLILYLLGPGAAARPQSLASQMDHYGVTSAQAESPEEARSLTEQAKGAAERALGANRSLEARIAQRLDGAGLSLRPSEWLLAHAGIAVATGIVGLLLGAGNPFLMLVFLILGIIAPWVYLGLKRARRLKAFGSGLADTLQLMSGSLSAGLSLAQSIDTIVNEGAEPISSEFKRVVVENRLGVGLEDAMEGVASRMESRDFGWVVMAIRIQREVGGNLAELLLTVAATLREREYLRRHVRALSAEGRLSCYVLGGLPPGFLLYLVLTKPDYVHPLFSTPLGFLMLGTMGVLLTVGIFWMSKVAKVDL